MSKTDPIAPVEAFNPDLPSVLKELEEGHYLFIVADSKKAHLFLFAQGKLESTRDIMDPGVMKKIKSNSGELNARNSKIMNRRGNQLRDHFSKILEEAANFIAGKHINGVFIGGHQPLFKAIENEMSSHLRSLMRGTFVTELNIPREELIAHCEKALASYTHNTI